MSHVIDTHFFFDSLEAMGLAAKRMGGELILGSQTYDWFGRHVGDYKLPKGRKKADMGTCDHEIKFPGCDYSIGVIDQGDGTYDLEYDFWGGGGGLINTIGGKDAGLLKQNYVVMRTHLEWAEQGVESHEEVNEDGDIQVVAYV